MKHIIPNFTDICSIENLFATWRDFRRGKLNKPDVTDFSLALYSNILSLHRDLTSGRYRHGEYQRFVICDPKRRIIHKATVRDRLIHHCLFRALYPYFDNKFIFDVYSSRETKGVHKAILRYQEFARRASNNYRSRCFILKCDITRCFISVDHEILKQLLAPQISDLRLRRLLYQVIDSFPEGLPLGNVTSQLLINIYLNQLDRFVKCDLKAKYYIRYTDDFVIMHSDPIKLRDFQNRIDLFLRKKLKMILKMEKVEIKSVYSGLDFLGWINFPTHRVLRTATKRRLIKNLSPKTLPSVLGILDFGSSYKIKISLNIKSREN